MSESHHLAVFDFDGTLIKEDSFILFARFAVGLPKFLWALFRSSVKLAKWKLGVCDSGSAKEVLFGHLYKGMPYARFERLGVSFVACLDKKIRHCVVNQMQEFVKAGVPVIILTASVPVWIEPWAKKYGVSKVVGTEIETDSDGLLTGRFKTPNCRGDEKVRRLLLAMPNLMNYEVWAYGDSAGDDALLSFATHSKKL